jgi:hypothetical protein
MCSNDPTKSRGNQEWAQWAHNSQYEDKQIYTIHSTKTNKHTQYTVRRQTNIPNIKYEDKQTYTIYSTKTNKHTQYTVRRQTNIYNTQYEDKQTYKTQHRTLNIWATLKVTKPSGIKNVNPSGTNQTVRRQTKQKYTTQNKKLKR